MALHRPRLEDIGTRASLESAGLPPGDLHALPSSDKRFPDGAQYRIEIPSTEGPACLTAVLEEDDRLEVTVHRVSQGSGVFLITDQELDHMREIGRAGKVGVSLFARANASWDNSGMSRSTGGQDLAPTSRGADQLVYGLDGIRRAAADCFTTLVSTHP